MTVKFSCVFVIHLGSGDHKSQKIAVFVCW